MADIQENKDLMREIQALVQNTEDRSPERIQGMKDLVEDFRNKKAQEGLEGSELDKEAKKFRTQLRREIKSLAATDVREFAYGPIMRLKIKDEEGVNLTKETLFEEKLQNFTIGDITQTKILEPAFQQTVDTFLQMPEFKEKFTQQQLDNLQHNIERIQQVLRRKISQGESKAKMKSVRFNIRKYLGATPLSKLGQRDDIYDYWEEISEKYTQFKEDLDALFVAANKSENEQFKNYFNKLNEKYGDENLEYIARFPTVKLSQIKPAERMVAVLENLLIMKGLSKKKIEVLEADEDDVDSSGQDAWEEQYMNQWNGLETTHRDDGFLEEQLADDSIDDVYADKTVEEETLFIDPLLAFEVMRGKKLLAFNDEGHRIITELLEALGQDDTTIDFQTDIEQMIDDIEDSFVSDKGEFFLPITIMKDTKFRTFAKYAEKLPSAVERDGITMDIEDMLSEMLDEIHAGLTSKKFGFASGVRATGRGGTLGSVFGADAGMAREAPRTSGGSYREQMGRLGGARSRPINPITRGELDESLEEFKGIIAKFLESATAYYITPMYAGRLPIETPSFISGRGAKVLEILARDTGLETVMGGAYELLSGIGASAIEVSDIRRIADFLEYLDKPNFEITDELIQAADDAADALTEIFGEDTEERNSDYMGALLMHFMEEIGDNTYADEPINGKSVEERAESFERSYSNREAFPIFALPHYIDRHQSLLTKEPAMKAQYKRLKKLFTKVEDDLPIVLNKLLKAHDAIRKQLGKKVEYGFMNLTYDSIDSVITKMHIEEGVDLSHLEVENIVKSDDSHNNISKEYGINTEQVYLIKANFR